MLNSFDSLHLAMFSGKGGVGKSTLSSAFACRWAKQFPNDRILLLSTDPAHSLGDVLQMEVSNTAQTIESLPNLSVRALDAELLLKDFKAEYGEILERLVERGSFVGQGDLASVWELGWSGLDELMGILEIQRLLRDRVVDRIVVDMAPSGHTLALFNLMEFLEEFLSALELFQLKHRTMSEAFTGRYTPDEVDLFLESMRRDLTDGRQLLQDSARSACFVVAIAEWLSLLESQRLIKALEALKIPFGGVFLNQVHAEREELVRKFQEIADPVLTFSQQSQEPIGIAALDRLITNHSEFVPSAIPIAPSQSLPDFILEQRKLILVGGKGGVGKTTVAAAIALNLSRQHPDRKIRVISIDPAHSLGDAFGTQLGHEPTDILPNLSAQEVDARTLLDRFREEYLWELADMMSGKTQDESLQIAYTPEAWRKIMAQALPGIDEMLALLEVMELLESNAQDLIILDTAPTGHLLRFLEMPSVLTDWLTWIFKLWLKYQNVAGHTELMSRLRTLRLRIIKTHKQLQNAEHTEFIGVVQARSTIFAETERLVRSLEPLQIHQRFIVNNRATQRLEEFAGKTVVNLPNAPSDLAPMAQIEKISEWLIAPNSIASLVSFNPQSQI
ncbi:ArsA family ATPase [Leptolyngbya sp. GGD]|uniref:ArsA family ATPase n=1 Tax=Leptolyngbya sp. GGD TaxID=2997907 RepID=UPI00227D6685|nr:ArsA family ATPase [Leptolyngbya sp. GGD]MCY6490122.1 ArsA family ATPase [Leptolyngbya sp. GGD]